MDGTRKSILLLATGGIIFANGRFSEDVGVLERCDDRGVPLLIFVVVFETFLERVGSDPTFFFPVGGFSWGVFLLREVNSRTCPGIVTSFRTPGGLPGFLFFYRRNISSSRRLCFFHYSKRTQSGGDGDPIIPSTRGRS